MNFRWHERSGFLTLLHLFQSIKGILISSSDATKVICKKGMIDIWVAGGDWRDEHKLREAKAARKRLRQLLA
jgi:hypothetical protein